MTFWLRGKVSSSGDASNAKLQKTCSGKSEFSSSGIEVELEQATGWQH